MKILLIMPYTPVPPNSGGPLRIYNIIKNIIPYHDVTMLLFGDDTDKERLCKEYGTAIQNVHVVQNPWSRTYKRLAQLYSTVGQQSFFHMMVTSKAMQSAIDSILSANSYDIVQTEFSHFGGHLGWFPWQPKVTAT